MVASIILLSIATLTSIFLAVFQWKKDSLEANTPSKRRTNNWILALGIFSYGLASFVGFKALSEQEQASVTAEEYRVKFELKQDQVIDLTRQIRDTAIKSLLLSSKLNNAQTQIIALQNSTLEQITGGRNKPILVASITTYYDYERKKTYAINYAVANNGKTVLRDVNFTVRNAYAGLDTIIAAQADGSFAGRPKERLNSTVNYSGPVLLHDISETGYNAERKLFALDRDVIKQANVTTLDRTYPSMTNLYSERIPSGAKNYIFVAKVEWGNGSYTAKTCLTECDSTTYFRYWKIYDHGKQINDVFKYFNIPFPKIPSFLLFCGQVSFDGETYQVYLHKENGSITLISRASIFAQTFLFYTATNRSEALVAAKKNLKKVFGKE